MTTVNIFTRYEQMENDFTNGLVAVLNLSRFDQPQLVRSLLHDELGLALDGEIDTFRVLQKIPGTLDAELRGNGCRVLLETKIVSGTLCRLQITRHLEALQEQSERTRRLLLLTPDDSRSRYIREYLSIDDRLMHVSWKRLYDFLQGSAADIPRCVFSELVRQFLERIHRTVFEQDIAGVVLKIHFGDKSEVYEGRYLDEMKSGMWNQWNTPREYRSLDGTGRKLLLYDRSRQGITVEVEIQKVERTDAEADYPWTNEFAPGTLRFFEPPICLERIRSLKAFENFGLHRKDRSPIRNITHDQYRDLTREQPAVPLAEQIDARERLSPSVSSDKSITTAP